MKAREAFHLWLERREVRRLFGNPGSTEVPMLVGLPARVRFTLGLQEAAVVAMADGYAQAAGRPALVELHAAPGLGNAIGALFTAWKNRTPMVVAVGQQDSRHLHLEPLLAADMAEMARGAVKGVVEPARPEDVAAAFERAWRLASTPPGGPVVVVVPSDFWDGPAESGMAEAGRVEAPGTPPHEAVEELARRLRGAGSPALVVGAAVDRAGAAGLAVELAERLGAAVWGDPLGPRASFPRDHPLYRGELMPGAPRIAQALLGSDFVLVVGAPAFLVYPFLPGPLVPPGSELWLLTDDPAEAARAVAERVLLGGVRASLEALLERVGEEQRGPEGLPPRGGLAERAWQRAEAARARGRMGVPFVLETLRALLERPLAAGEEGWLVVDEAVSASPLVRRWLATEPGGYLTAASGGLGWGLAAAVGAKLARPERRVLAVVGDGAFLYAPQALWTASQEGVALPVVVLDNGGYAILKSYAAAYYPGRADATPGLELPGLDPVRLAEALGGRGVRVEAPADLAPALAGAMEARGPFVVDVAVDRSVPHLFE
ncbi:MAG: thiamine pyrophosphate-binding protein [Bacillota bacterium]|nr:thiamine pyrophosphate-binding protein [Bacillota bacterium]